MSKTVNNFASWNGEIKDDKYWKRKLDETAHETKKEKDQLVML